MKWVRFRIRTTPAAEDIIVGSMMDIGLYGAQIEDNVPLTAAEKEQIYTYDVEDPVDDGIAYVSFYCEAEGDRLLLCEEGGGGEAPVLREIAEMRAAIAEVLARLREWSDIGDGTITVDTTEDADWINNWKQYFHKFYIDDILVLPSWEKADAADAQAAGHVLRIDPGTAFGTGQHETTQLAIRLLREYVTPGTRLLDVGTGSGILSILALKFGAQEATGVEIDPRTREAITDNLAANGINGDEAREKDGGQEEAARGRFRDEAQEEGAQARFRLRIGNLLEDAALREEIGGGYDTVVANILPVVLTPLTPFVPSFLKAGGIYIASGILTEKEPQMRRVIEAAGLRVTGTRTQGEWCAITARKEP